MNGEFPAQMASNAENVSIWWRHHADIDWALASHFSCCALPGQHLVWLGTTSNPISGKRIDVTANNISHWVLHKNSGPILFYKYSIAFAFPYALQTCSWLILFVPVLSRWMWSSSGMLGVNFHAVTKPAIPVVTCCIVLSRHANLRSTNMMITGWSGLRLMTGSFQIQYVHVIDISYIHHTHVSCPLSVMASNPC